MVFLIPDFEMQVWTGTIASASDPPDHVTSFHPLADHDT